MAKQRIPEQERAHDVLAAEEFGVGVADPGLHHGPITLPDDPTGIAEPHDVLAAEEFAMPAPRPGSHAPSDAHSRRYWARVAILGAAAVILFLGVRRRDGRA
jgi:hypothetical protein